MSTRHPRREDRLILMQGTLDVLSSRWRRLAAAMARVLGPDPELG